MTFEIKEEESSKILNDSNTVKKDKMMAQTSFTGFKNKINRNGSNKDIPIRDNLIMESYTPTTNT